MRYLPLAHGSIGSAIKTSVICASFGLIGGIWLQYSHEDLLLITPLFLALPALSAMSGDLASIITAHIGDPETSTANRKKLFRTLALIIPVNTLGVTSLSIFFTRLQEYELGRQFICRYAAFVFATFALVTLTIALMSIVLNKILSQKRINSDDVLIPVANVVASALILIAISLAVRLLF